MKRSKIFLCLAALLVCVVLTAAALAESTLAGLWNSGCDFLFRTDNVTVTGEASFSLDGTRFKTAKLNYIQDGYSSFYGLTLLTPKKDGTEQETGWTIIADEDGGYAVMEAYYPGVYRTGCDDPQKSLLRRTIRLDALTELGGLLVAQAEPLLPEGAVTVSEADGTRTVHIALAEGQTPDFALSALNMAANYLADRWFGSGYDYALEDIDIFPYEHYLTVTEALLGGTVKWTLRSADVDFSMDAQNRLTAVSGTAHVATTYWDGTERTVEVAFDFAATDYGASHVTPFNPSDYKVVQYWESAWDDTEYEWTGEDFGENEFPEYDDPTQLPSYAYTGDDLLEAAVAEYTAEIGKGYLLQEGAVSIPCPVILKTEVDNETSARVYGAFWVFNYVLEEETLQNISGGENAGIMTLEKTADGWKVTAFEQAGDGDDYAKDIQRFCQGDKTLEAQYFAANDAKNENVASVRAQYIRDYVSANRLYVKAWRDYGREAVPLFQGPTGRVITAMASEINPEHVASVAVDARITGYNAADNTLTVELLVPEVFAGEEVGSLAIGDAIFTQGREVVIETISERYGYLVINEGDYEFSEGSVWLYDDLDGNYQVADWDDTAWTTLAALNAPVKDGLILLDWINPSSGETLNMPTVHNAAEFLSMLAGDGENYDPGFDVNNVYVVFNDAGDLAVIQRYYVPWQ